MSGHSVDAAASYKHKRRSLLSRSPLSAIYDTSPALDTSTSTKVPSKNVQKRWTPPVVLSKPPSPISLPPGSSGDGVAEDMADAVVAKPTARPTSSLRPGAARPNSIFGSLRSWKSIDEGEDPWQLTPSASNSPSELAIPDAPGRSKNVLCHGEVQTSSSLFRKRKEYLVLTETHLFKLKGQQKACEMFSVVPPPLVNRNSMIRHVSTPSGGSNQDAQSFTSETLEKDYGTPLRQVVAVYQLDDGAPYYAIQVDYLDEDDNQAASFVLRFPDPDERENWLRQIRAAANAATLADPNPISVYNHQTAARCVEAERDYDPSNYAIYKVVQRSNKTGARSSSEDLTKIGSTVCFLAIGVHHVHLINLFKRNPGVSTPQLGHAASPPKTYGIVTLTGMSFSQIDDTFEMMFRIPFQSHRILHLASLAGRDIAARFRQVEELLRPEWETRPYLIRDPDHTRADSAVHLATPPVDADSFDRTLIAYCVAYGLKPDRIRYLISDGQEDGPTFDLLPPASTFRTQYSDLELLAIMRALRYNESFGAISFANVHLDVLNDAYDNGGSEHLCIKTKRGTPLKMSFDDMASSRMLVQEIRALAMTSKKLRRMDFTSCIKRQPRNSDEGAGVRDQGCGIAEALFPLCRSQITNVDWIVLSGIHLGETDLDYLVGAAVDRSCHFRAIEMSDCGLTDRSLMLCLDALRAQDDTMETVDISRNVARLSPTTFGAQLGMFGFLRKLNLSHLSRTSDADSLIPLDTLLSWRLEELFLSNTLVNAATLDVICRYLLSSRCDLMRELRMDHTSLSSRDLGQLMRAVARHPGGLPLLHVDLSQNELERDHHHLTSAIRDGLTPTLLTIRLMEYEDETNFRDLVQALTLNDTITHLDISRAYLPSDVSDSACHALERLFADNTTLAYLDISGENSRLESSKLGVGISNSLSALKNNTALRCLRIHCQNLGLRGAHTLADIIKANGTLRELHCENNSIPLSGFMGIVNALKSNTSLLYLSGAEDSQREAHHLAELQIKNLRDDYNPSHHYSNLPVLPKSASIRDRVGARLVGNGLMKGMQSKERASSAPASLHKRSRSKQIQVTEALEAIGDLDRVWERQVELLNSYLDRNNNLAHAALLKEDGGELMIPGSGFMRPDMQRGASAMTIEKIMAAVGWEEEEDETAKAGVGGLVGDDAGNPSGSAPLEVASPHSLNKRANGPTRDSTPDVMSVYVASPTRARRRISGESENRASLVSLASPVVEMEKIRLEEIETAMAMGGSRETVGIMTK